MGPPFPMNGNSGGVRGGGRGGGRHGGGRAGGRGFHSGHGRGGFSGGRGRGGAPYHHLQPPQTYARPHPSYPPPLPGPHPNAFVGAPSGFGYPPQQPPPFSEHLHHPPQYQHHHQQPQYLPHSPYQHQVPPYDYAPPRSGPGYFASPHHQPPQHQPPASNVYGHHQNVQPGVLPQGPSPYAHHQQPHQQQPQRLHPQQHQSLHHSSQRTYTTNTQSFRDADNARQRAYLPVTAAVATVNDLKEEKKIEDEDDEDFEDERPRMSTITPPSLPSNSTSTSRTAASTPVSMQPSKQHPTYSNPSSQHPLFPHPHPQPHQPTPNHRPPPPSYLCHKCHTPGHWIQQCPLNHQTPLNYQRSSIQLDPVTMSSTHPPPPNPTVEPSPLNDGEDPFHCEPCDKSFPMESQYLAHNKTHVTCWAPDCGFEGSKRVVGAHYQSTHGQFAGSGLKEIEVEGQKFMVLMGNSPAEIAAWRAERRNKWPKKEEGQKKRKREEEKEDGQVDSEDEKEVEQGEVHDLSQVADTMEDGEEVPDAPVEDGSKPNEPVSTEIVDRPVKKLKRPVLCKQFLRNQCASTAEQCRFSHDRSLFPCRVFQRKGSCPKQHTTCGFKHEPTDRKQDKATEKPSLLMKLLQPEIEKVHLKMLEMIEFMSKENMIVKTT